MRRVRAGLFWGVSLYLLGCGARTALLSESEPSDGGQPSGGNRSAAGNSSGGGGSNGNGGHGVVGSIGGASSGGSGSSSVGGSSAGGTTAGTGSTGGSGTTAGRGSTGGGGSGGMIVVPPPVRTNCQLSGDDPRVAGIKPDEIAHLDGADFVIGDVTAYHWTVQMEDCDAVVQNTEIILQDVDSRVVTFQPSRPAFYHFTLDVTGAAGDHATCKLEVPVEGTGMRVELCWDTSTTTDLDLYLHTPFDRAPWFERGTGSLVTGLNGTTCNTSNAAAELRDNHPRVDWGYQDSPLSACNTPSFKDFLSGGRCPNPRAADDNNQSIATGTTERMQLDDPGDGQRFRVMVQNFSNRPAQPHVFVYCSGQRAAAFDAPPFPHDFVANNPGIYGVMWRAMDIATTVDASGKVSCDVTHVPGALTIDNLRF